MNLYRIKTRDILSFILVFIIVVSFFWYKTPPQNNEIIIKLTLCIISLFLNILIVFAVNNHRIIPLILLGASYILCINAFTSMNFCISFLLFTFVLFLLICNFLYKYKYFNIGFFTTLIIPFYPPALLFIICFFIISLFIYEVKINVSQYIVGVFTSILFIIEILFISNHLNILSRILSFNPLEFHFSFWIIFLLLILFYSIIEQTQKNETRISLNFMFILSVYLFFWIITLTLFMNNNYLLLYTSLPSILIVCRRLNKIND